MNTHLLSAKLRSPAPQLLIPPRIRFVACAILSLCLALTARAADITVTNTNDSGPGSLRQAVIDAPAGGSIDFNIPATDPGYNATTGVYTLTLTTGEIAIFDKNVTITGPGQNVFTISGNHTNRSFETSGGDIKISGMTIADGYEYNYYANGAGILVRSGSLTANQCAFIGNFADNGDGALCEYGGTLTVTDCLFQDNRSGAGGAIYVTAGVAAVSGSTFIHNTGLSAIMNSGALSLTNCTITGSNGGAISTNQNSTTNIVGCAISGNSNVLNDGSGLFNLGVATVSNSTIAQNSADYPGGGICNRATLTLSNCTVTQNSVNDTGGGTDGGGVYNSNGATLKLSQTIIAGNTSATNPDVFGNMTSQGYNLIGATDGSTGFGATGDQVGTVAAPLDPMLGPLQDNGGPTLTVMPLSGSPAIDMGDPAFNVQTLPYDQRGYQRVANGRLDIGAVESSSYLNKPPTAVAGPNATAHAGTLVTLNGGSSYDDNTPAASLGYAWSFVMRPAGSNAVLSNANTATPSFTPDQVGNYQVQLIVTDNGYPALSSAPTVVTYSSYNQAPTAVASASTNLPLVGQTVTLSSAGSTDPDGDAITYQWTLTQAPAGSHATIASATSPTATIKPDVKGTYTVTLTPSDFLGAGTPATATFSTTTTENYIHQELLTAATLVASLPANQVTSRGNQKDFVQRLQHANKEIQHGRYLHAILDIELAIIRTDGVPQRGHVDTNGLGRDWILSSSAQITVYNDLINARNALFPYHDCDDHQEIDNY